jgi:hypothetical protein
MASAITGLNAPNFFLWGHVNSVVYRIHRIFLDFFNRPVFKKTRRFGNWICFRPQVKLGEKTPTQLGPLERANLNHWKKSRKILWILYNIHHHQNPFKSISVVYVTPVDSREELIVRIHAAFEQIQNRPQMFDRVRQSLLWRCNECNQVQGRRFEHLL